MTATAHPESEASCPSCRASLPDTPGWPRWCPACNWNLDTDEPAQTTTWRQRLGERIALRLYDDLAVHPLGDVATARRGMVWSVSLLAAFALATLVHAASLLLAWTGFDLLVLQPWHNGWVVLGAAMLLLLAWLALPARAQPPDAIVARSEAPTLYLAADRIAAAMGAAAPTGIAISAELNASYRVCGWRSDRYVELGLPLLAVLDGPERMALLAHELSHGANGDPLRGRYLFGAYATLEQWGQSLRPVHIGGSEGGLVGVLAVPFELVQLALSEFMRLLAFGVVLLVMRESQRAEYLADRLAAAVSGARAMRTALEKLGARDAIELAVSRHALNGREDSLLPVLRETVAALPDSERERLRRLSRMRLSRVDATHPPTALRVELLARSASVEPPPVLSESEFAALDAELVRLMPAIQRKLTNHYLVGLYG